MEFRCDTQDARDAGRIACKVRQKFMTCNIFPIGIGVGWTIRNAVKSLMFADRSLKKLYTSRVDWQERGSGGCFQALQRPRALGGGPCARGEYHLR